MKDLQLVVGKVSQIFELVLKLGPERTYSENTEWLTRVRIKNIKKWLMHAHAGVRIIVHACLMLVLCWSCGREILKGNLKLFIDTSTNTQRKFKTICVEIFQKNMIQRKYI